jgi:hypothetical protein
MTGWQPIETAPKDKSILAFVMGVDGRPMIYVAWWAHLPTWFTAVEIPHDAAEWEWVSGWSRILQPTHWLPLPPPPTNSTPTKGD